VDVAITADLGTLQRLPKLVGYGNAMELALTARRFGGAEARSLGLVQGVMQSKEELDAHVQSIALQIAAKSPLAVTGTKTVLIKSRDMTVAQGLEYVGLWNAAMLDSEDLQEALQAQVQKRTPHFSKL
jgi:delta(3,5)-delta(2,4)-dienoyl-CoA isomerase